METILSKMGWREIGMAGELLKAYADGSDIFASDDDEMNFCKDGLELGFNENSGFVFLTNDDYQALLLNDNNKLEMFLTCQECGNEGLRSDVEFAEENQCKKCWTKNNVPA